MRRCNPPPDSPDTRASVERVRLIRLCAALAGDAAIAEDLAQETLLEAWRQRRKLRDAEGRWPWLAAIARNVCRRWRSRRASEAGRSALPGPGDAPDCEDRLPDPFDLELALERDELAALLDRALALLPPQTRAVLVARYIGESSHAEIAARLGLSPEATRVAVHRGKLILRRLLLDELREEAAAYGLAAGGDGTWRETRLWCPLCGQRRLRGRWDRSPRTGQFVLTCPGCCPDPALGAVSATAFGDVPALSGLLGGGGGWRAALARVMVSTRADFLRGLRDGGGPCPKCGHPAPVRPVAPAHWASSRHVGHHAHLACAACRITPNAALAGMALALPEAQQFWRRHPRLRLLPERAILAEGRPAILTTFESLTAPARIEVLSAPGTYETREVRVAHDA